MVTACWSPSLALLPADVRDVYFESVGVIITLILFGSRLLEAKAKAGTGEAIRALLGLQARTARVVRDGVETEIPIEDVAVGGRDHHPAWGEGAG